MTTNRRACADRRATYADSEVADIQKQLGERRLEVQRIQDLVDQAHAEKDAAHRACSAGIASAKTQMDRLKIEIVALRHAEAEPDGGSVEAALYDENSVDAVPSPLAEAQADAAEDLKHENHYALRMEARKLRHDLSKWKHQAEVLEAERPKQNDEIARLKVELTHLHEVLESTRHAVKHQEVDQTLQQADNPGKNAAGTIKLFAGGHGRVEALAERGIRERTEKRNEDMCAKAKQLTNIVAAQQLLIQRLEKQLVFDGGLLERKTAKLADESTRQKGLKTVMRKCSDEAVFLALRGPVMAPARKKRTMPKQMQRSDLFFDDPQDEFQSRHAEQAASERAPPMPRAESVPLLPRI